MSSNINGIAPIGCFQYYPSSPTLDYDYIDMDGTMYPYMGMGGSVFGATPPSGIGTDMAGMGMFGNNQSYFDNMKQYQQFYNDYYVEQQKMNRNADLRINGSMESIQETAANLKDKIMQNEQDQIMEAYKKYVDCVKHTYGAGTEEEVNSRAINLYRQFTGKGLIQDLRENSHCSALQGFIQAITLGTYSRRSAEDNIADITGQSVSIGEKTAHNAGRLAGAATIGTAAYFGVKSLAGKTGIRRFPTYTAI